MAEKTIQQSLWIAALSSAADQTYHTILDIGHSAILNSADPSTWAYIFSKFVIVFLASWLIITYLKKVGDYGKALAIGIVGAIGFAVTLAIILPAQYSVFLHLAHFVIIAYSAYLVFERDEKKWSAAKLIAITLVSAVILSLVAKALLPLLGYGGAY